MSLTYLNVHTFFSSAGGPHSPEEWRCHAADLGYTQFGIADRAPLPALPSLLRASPETSLSPFIGVELDLQAAGDSPTPLPIVLLPTSHEGLQNLAILSNIAYSQWPQAEKPVALASLAEHSQGIALILPDPSQLGEDALTALKASFAERAFVGFPHSGTEEDDTECTRLAGIAGRLGLPGVALPTARYLRPDDKPAYEALRKARALAGWACSVPLEPEYAYLRKPQEAQALFGAWPEAIANNEWIAALCSGVLDPADFRAPAFSGSELAALKSAVESRLPGILGTEEIPPEVRERLDREWAAIEQSGSGPAWNALSRLAEVAQQRKIPLGALLGRAGDSLVAAALWGKSLPDFLGHSEPPWLSEHQAPGYIGIEVPAERREELLGAFTEEPGIVNHAFAAAILEITPMMALRASYDVLNAGSGLTETAEWEGVESAAQGTGTQADAARLALALKGSPISLGAERSTVILPGDVRPLMPVLNGADGAWVPWTCNSPGEMGYPILTLRSTRALSLLNAACALTEDIPQATSPSEHATALLKKGEIAGIPYLSAKAFKGWKGDFDLAGLAMLVALSSYPKERPKAPEGIEAWTEKTSDTAGSLLYFDQFAAIASAVASIASHEAPSLRAAMLNPDRDADGTLRARFMAGCLQSGLEEDKAVELYKAMSGAAPGLISRQAAHSHALVALSLLELKAQHPVAFIAAWLGTAWEHGGRDACVTVVDETRRLGIHLLPPDVHASAANPGIEKDEQENSAVRWGLAQLPGWTRPTAEQFVKARETLGCTSLADAFTRVREAGLSLGQVATLVQSGAMDAYGWREALHSSLPSLLEWSRNPGGPLPTLPETPLPSPRTRYLVRQWEEQNLGVGFVSAPEMENLRKLLDAAGDLRSRVTTTKQIGASLVGQSICLVGLFHDIRLLENPNPDSKIRPGEEPQPLAVARVEDFNGDIELVAFPPNYKRHNDLWIENNPVIITARVYAQDEEGDIYLLCEHLAPFGGRAEEEMYTVKVKASRRSETVPLPTPDVKASDGGSNKPSAPIPPPVGRPETHPAREAENSTATIAAPEAPGYHLVITLPISDDDHADIDRMIALNRLLRSHPGPDSVTLRIPYSPESGAVTTAQLPRGVRYSPALEEDIFRLLGPDSLALIRLVG